MQTLTLGVLAAVAGLADTSAAAVTGPDFRGAGQTCDRLAATNDGSAPTPPVPLREMDGEAALQACRDAVMGADARPRHHVQLARALIKLGRPVEARRHVLTAAAGGNASALYVLGQMHHMGVGAKADKPRALALYRRALDKGYLEAAFGLLMLYRDSASPLFDPEKAEEARLMLIEAGIYK